MNIPTDLMRSLSLSACEALSQMDLPRFLSLFSNDAVMDFPYAPEGLPKQLRGVHGIAEGMSVMPVMFSSFSLSPTHIYVSPQSRSVILQATSRGVFRTGGMYSNVYAMVHTSNGDKLTRWREYYNPLKVQAAS